MATNLKKLGITVEFKDLQRYALVARTRLGARSVARAAAMGRINRVIDSDEATLAATCPRYVDRMMKGGCIQQLNEALELTAA